MFDEDYRMKDDDIRKNAKVQIAGRSSATRHDILAKTGLLLTTNYIDGRNFLGRF
jgi:hypothetical protein